MKVYPMKSTPESQYERSGPTFQEALRNDPIQPPADILEDHRTNLGLQEYAKSRYTSPAFHALEIERMWTRVWQVACLADEIPEPGDVTTYEIGDQSFIITHTANGEFRAFYNSCMHRGLKLCTGTTHLSQIRCPFHGFTWNLDGSLKYVPARWDFPQVSDESHKLREVKVDTWAGFVFINMDPDCKPLAEYLEVFPEHFSGFSDQSKKHCVGRYRKIIPCNWKLGIEAFMESYHSMETHPQALPYSAEANVQYDIFPGARHTSRFLQTMGVQSSSLERELSSQEIVDVIYSQLGQPAPELGEDADIRSMMVRMARESARRDFGVDYDECSDVELLDAMQYFLFPNIILFRGFSFPVGYRFRPNHNDPDTAIFDFMIFRDVPTGQERPELPEVIDLGDKSFTDGVDNLPAELKLVYDQDLSNMALQQQGLHVGGKTTVTMSEYQESRLRHLHQTLDEYLAMAPPALSS